MTRHRSWTKRRGMLAAALAGTTLLPWPSQVGRGADASGTEAPLLVEIVTAEVAPVTLAITLTGTIEAENTYTASFRVGGQVIEVAVDVDGQVEPGEVLARVDPTQAEAAAAAARASLSAAEAALRQAEQARDRATSLLARGAGTQAEAEATSEAALTARSSRDQAAVELAKAQRALEDTVLTALDEAVVTERLADPGEVVAAGQAVLTLADDGGREAVFLAPDVASLGRFVGQPARLSLLEGDDASFEAALTEVSPVVAEDGTVEVKVALSGGQGASLPIGTPVGGQVELAQAPAISVPWSALTATADGPAVWTVDPQTMAVSLTPVTISGYADEAVQVADGLAEGDLVVGAGSQALYAGRVVQAEGTP